jgi:glycosyltransferase involved in cell wall biosynthesis
VRPDSVSVVVPTYNKAGLLRRTLESLAANEPSGFEVVVVSDGSTDGTAKLLDGFRAPFALVPVLLEANRGRAGARNAGLSRAAGDLVILLDDDMEVAPDFVAAHRAFHAREGMGRRVAGIGNVSERPEVLRTGIGRYMGTRGAQKIRETGRLPWKYFSSNNASARREDFEAIGRFDEAFRTYGFEDLEIALRLEKERGVSFHFVPEARSTHLETYDLEDVLRKKRLSGRRSLRRLLAKHPDAAKRLAYDRYLAGGGRQEGADPGDSGGPADPRFPTRGAYRLLFSGAVYGPALALARGLGPRAPDLLFDYLVLRNYLAGLDEPEASG